LEVKFDDDYEDIGRHSESGYLRKLSSTQIPQKVVFTGCLKIDGVLLFVKVLTEQVRFTVSLCLIFAPFTPLRPT
jgi:hypothetical protein